MADLSLPLLSRFWGEEKFADATVVMGKKTWRLHRMIICKQSQYFEKALEGHFEEAKTKTINLTGCEFPEEEVEGLLKYLYFQQLDGRQQRHPIATFVIADYFQVKDLRQKACNEAGREIQAYIDRQYYVNFKNRCHDVFGKFPDTELEANVVKVMTDNIQFVMYESGAWDELTGAYPSLATKVLKVLYPKPEPSTGVKRPASLAFDDTAHLQSMQTRSRTHRFRPGSNIH